MKKARNFLTVYLPTTPYVLIYMLQQTEYDPDQFLSWVNRLPNYLRVIKRKKLVYTKKAVLLLALAYGIWISMWAGLVLLVLHGWYLAVAAAFAWIPFVLVLSLAAVICLAYLPLNLKRGKDLKAARNKMKHHKGVKIAVLGSYGKTTLKELLAMVLGEGKKVAVTPGNKNVAISHARWIMGELSGDEDIVIFEYGEYRPGDIADLAWLTRPDYAVITGFAPNHIDTYKTVEALKADLASIAKFVPADNLYASAQAAKAIGLQLDDTRIFDTSQALGWQISVDQVSFDGLQLTLKKGKQTLKLKSSLLGRHLAAPLGVAAALALQLGLTPKQVAAGLAKTTPFEHRLQPISLGGAWVIDDTYNGNLEGIKAGLALLQELPAKRKIYVTPGLVEQGSEKERVHKEIAEHIIAVQPDEVVLMRNSSTGIIDQALQARNFDGKVAFVDDPLDYYENLQYQLAAGDVVLMQNDWTDNYN